MVELPLESPWIECPECGVDRALHIGPYGPREGAHVWRCVCGGELFYLTSDGILCPACGREPKFGSMDV